MKRLKGFSLILIFIYTSAFSQIKVSGYIYDEITDLGINNVSVFNPETNDITYSNRDGYYEIILNSYNTEISFYLEGYNLYTKIFKSDENQSNESDYESKEDHKFRISAIKLNDEESDEDEENEKNSV